MLTGASAAAGAQESESRKANGIDNQQVLEFLRLIEEWKQVAALLDIRPLDGKRQAKRSIPA